MKSGPAGAALAAFAALCVCACSREPAQAEATLAQDARLDWLLQPFPRDDHYDADTSDTLGILVEVLTHGHKEPLKRARIEIAEEGSAGMDAMRQVIEATWNDPLRFADIRNALDVCAYSGSQEAHDLVVRVMHHESPTSRQAAWRALRTLAQPQDYERVRELLDSEGAEFMPELAQLLSKADPERAAAEYLAWIQSGRYEALWLDVARGIAEARSPTVARLACELTAQPGIGVQTFVSAACARSGDEQALAKLREWQRSDEAGFRQAALEALVSADLAEELVWSLERDPDPRLRARAVQVLGAKLPPEQAEPLLVAAMSDSDDTVANTAMGILAARLHPGALERAFQDLSSERLGALEGAALVLAPLLAANPELATRTFERLRARIEEEASLGLEQRRGGLRAMGLVPTREAAVYLDGISREIEGEIQTMRAPHWVLLQIGNGGEPGQRYLIEALAQEADPLRRLDLIDALASTPTELARSWLLERAQAEDVAPYELLYIADRLTRLGPAKRVAPVLKRATLRVQQNDVRRALQGLLWMWYPAPRRA